jgi:hypothetical protein
MTCYIGGRRFPFLGRVECVVVSCSFKDGFKLSLCLTRHHAIKTYWEVEVYLHAFLTSALDGGEWSTSSPVRYTRSTHCLTGCWVDALRKEKKFLPLPRIKPREGSKPSVYWNEVTFQVVTHSTVQGVLDSAG